MSFWLEEAWHPGLEKNQGFRRYEGSAVKRPGIFAARSVNYIFGKRLSQTAQYFDFTPMNYITGAIQIVSLLLIRPVKISTSVEGNHSFQQRIFSASV